MLRHRNMTILTSQLFYQLFCTLLPFVPKPGKIQKKRGRPRVAPSNVVLALALIGGMFQVPWRQMPDLVQSCSPLFQAGYLTKTPSYSVFYQAWNNLTTPHLNLLLLKLAKKGDRAAAVDSSGVRTSRSNLWRHLKWKKLSLSKTSSEFYKVHIAVGITTGSVLAYFLTPSRIHDSRAFPFLWKQMPKTLTRILMDKAYWS